MNEASAVLIRLLNIYPVEAIKKHWSSDKTTLKTDLIAQVVARHSAEDVHLFVKRYSGLTKQNVYVYEMERRPSPLPSFLADADNLSTPQEKDAGKYFFLANLKYKVFVRPADTEMEVIFKWPVRIMLTGKRLILHCTTMEKNVRTYFPTDHTVYTQGRSMEEEDIVKAVRESFPAVAKLEACDLNKGVKHLWDANVIDSPAAKYKADISTITESMDGMRLIKRDRPLTYQAAMAAPLFKTPFFLLAPEGQNVEHFSVNPSAGEFNFTTFSPSEAHVDYVLGEILKHN